MIMKIKMLAAIAVHLLMMSPMGCTAAPEENRSPVPLSISDISPGTTRADVVRKLGRPQREEISDGFIVKSYEYIDLEVGFDETDKVAFVESRSARACIFRTICMGADLRNMQRELRSNGYLSTVVGKKLIGTGDDCWAEIGLDGDIAKSVAILCAP